MDSHVPTDFDSTFAPTPISTNGAEENLPIFNYFMGAGIVALDQEGSETSGTLIEADESHVRENCADLVNDNKLNHDYIAATSNSTNYLNYCDSQELSKEIKVTEDLMIPIKLSVNPQQGLAHHQPTLNDLKSSSPSTPATLVTGSESSGGANGNHINEPMRAPQLADYIAENEAGLSKSGEANHHETLTLVQINDMGIQEQSEDIWTDLPSREVSIADQTLRCTPPPIIQPALSALGLPLGTVESEVHAVECLGEKLLEWHERGVENVFRMENQARTARENQQVLRGVEHGIGEYASIPENHKLSTDICRESGFNPSNPSTDLGYNQSASRLSPETTASTTRIPQNGWGNRTGRADSPHYSHSSPTWSFVSLSYAIDTVQNQDDFLGYPITGNENASNVNSQTASCEELGSVMEVSRTSNDSFYEEECNSEICGHENQLEIVYTDTADKRTSGRRSPTSTISSIDWVGLANGSYNPSATSLDISSDLPGEYLHELSANSFGEMRFDAGSSSYCSSYCSHDSRNYTDSYPPRASSIAPTISSSELDPDASYDIPTTSLKQESILSGERKNIQERDAGNIPPQADAKEKLASRATYTGAGAASTGWPVFPSTNGDDYCEEDSKEEYDDGYDSSEGYQQSVSSSRCSWNGSVIGTETDMEETLRPSDDPTDLIPEEKSDLFKTLWGTDDTLVNTTPKKTDHLQSASPTTHTLLDDSASSYTTESSIDWTRTGGGNSVCETAGGANGKWNDDADEDYRDMWSVAGSSTSSFSFCTTTRGGGETLQVLRTVLDEVQTPRPAVPREFFYGEKDHQRQMAKWKLRRWLAEDECQQAAMKLEEKAETAFSFIAGDGEEVVEEMRAVDREVGRRFMLEWESEMMHQGSKKSLSRGFKRGLKRLRAELKNIWGRV